MTNYKELKTLLQQRLYVFESETDTEVIAKLIYHLWEQHPNYSFRELVEQVVQQLVSAATNNNGTGADGTNAWRRVESTLNIITVSASGINRNVT